MMQEAMEDGRSHTLGKHFSTGKRLFTVFVYSTSRVTKDHCYISNPKTNRPGPYIRPIFQTSFQPVWA
jgi:hypothetical protein